MSPKQLNLLKSISNKIQETINTDFFIAGGSVYSIYNNNENYNDIDVFFYKKQDFITAEENLPKYFEISNNSEYAITFFNEDKKIQLIKNRFGTPEEILSEFDLNLSKIAFEPKTEEIFIHNNFYNLLLEADNINYSTLMRYIKYCDKKNAPYDKESYQDLIRRLFFSEEYFELYYNKEIKKELGINIIKQTINLLNSNSHFYRDIVEIVPAVAI